MGAGKETHTHSYTHMCTPHTPLPAPCPALQHTLPHVQVSVSCFDRTHTVEADTPSVNPRFARNAQRFDNVALSNMVAIKVGGGHGGLQGLEAGPLMDAYAEGGRAQKCR